MLCLLEKLPEFRNSESEIRNLKQRTESNSKQLGGWIQSVLNSGMRGQRYVTEKTRVADRNRVGRDEFLKKLDRVRRGEPFEPSET